jgi:hypothetical protein
VVHTDKLEQATPLLMLTRVTWMKSSSQDKTTITLGTLNYEIRLQFAKFLYRVYDFANVKDWDQNQRKSILLTTFTT